ncbi:MAG: sigma-70 family RNA polymerase sigma factor [Prevotella sp.]|uniref:RNA polymerase sigma factor n=1 Tax=Leyella stercorea TaxID=363265 RepID=UPI001F45A49F|nr:MULTISPECIES: sigma-70 family RNA polymerase sigma factor [Prevotellaceae]MCF2578102.1 sigma-70 family RNA polymerase sigma factor [Leyella stercorea]MCI7184484.1 sigma-70 family RNA polymerase sigma factor [Prevotella sp.]
MKKLQDMTDEELALSYIDGNNRAFDLLLLRNQSNIYSYILFIVHDRETAEDLFQDTFVKAIAYMQDGRYTTSGKFAGWLMRIAHNTVMDWYRSLAQFHFVEANKDNDLSNVSDPSLVVGNIENQYVNSQTLKDVRRLLDMLPMIQREVVYMRFYQQLSFKEIAETTNCSINTALGRMRYAVLNMRRMAKTYGMTLQLSI